LAEWGSNATIWQFLRRFWFGTVQIGNTAKHILTRNPQQDQDSQQSAITFETADMMFQ
jgi:hypothetical protein